MENTESVDVRIIEDIKYIQNDILVELKGGMYCKFSRILNQIAILQITKEQYIKYWQIMYKSNKQNLKIITDVCEDKFANGLVSKEKMLEILSKSKDTDDERNRLISMLK